MTKGTVQFSDNEIFATLEFVKQEYDAPCDNVACRAPLCVLARLAASRGAATMTEPARERLSEREITELEVAHRQVIERFPHSDNRISEQVLAALAELRERRAREKAFNLNDRVLIRLTAHGEQLYQDYYRGMGLDPEHYRKFDQQGDGRLRMELWQVMRIFGAGCEQAMQPPIQTNVEWYHD